MLPSLDCRPHFFEVEISSPFHDSFFIEIKEKNLYYRHASTMFDMRNTRSRRIPISDKKWNLFLGKLDAMNVWSWNRSYVDKSIADGVNWRVNIIYEHQGGRALDSRGSNSFPANYDEFLKALRELLGNQYKIY